MLILEDCNCCLESLKDLLMVCPRLLAAPILTAGKLADC